MTVTWKHRQVDLEIHDAVTDAVWTTMATAPKVRGGPRVRVDVGVRARVRSRLCRENIMLVALKIGSCLGLGREGPGLIRVTGGSPGV